MQLSARQGVLAHWSVVVDDFSTSAMDFYTAVEQAVRRREPPDAVYSRIERKEAGVESAKREYLRIQRGQYSYDICAAPFGQTFFFSSWLAAMPFGNALLVLVCIVGGGGLLGAIGLGVASEMKGCVGYILLGLATVFGLPLGLYFVGRAINQGYLYDEELVLMTPYIGWIYNKIFNPNSYFSLDSVMAFRTIVHQAVLEVVDGLHEEHGMRALLPTEREATLRNLTE